VIALSKPFLASILTQGRVVESVIGADSVELHFESALLGLCLGGVLSHRFNNVLGLRVEDVFGLHIDDLCFDCGCIGFGRDALVMIVDLVTHDTDVGQVAHCFAS